MVVNESMESMAPRAELVCRPNSHPFQDRTLVLTNEQSHVKVGRSVARARPAPNNAIFDCKVLSRNHALLWYENGKFYLQDTKSSNGTFVNNQRLSKGSEESLPREVCSGDIIQFGVDVMENSRKVTHGCIIATVRLYLPDGKEAKASPTIVSSPSSIPTQDLYQLNQYIQEALAREQLLETKLAVLQRLVGQTENASNEAWKSLIDEDRLLTRVEILESQLSTYSKSMTEDKLREETKRLMEEKEQYQETAKETLKKLVDEKLEAIKKVKEIEKDLNNTQDEFETLKELYERNIEENRNLSERVNTLNTDLEELKSKAEKQEEENGDKNDENEEEEEDVKVKIETIGNGMKTLKSRDSECLENTTTEISTNCDDEEAVPTELEKELSELRASNSNLLAENRTVKAELAQVKQQLDTPASKESRGDASDELRADNEKLLTRISSLESEVAQAKAENQRLHAVNEELLHPTELETSTSSSSAEMYSQLEQSLSEAEEKIAQLIHVKEKFAEVASEKSMLEQDVCSLEREIEVLSVQSRTATACSLIPLLCLVFAIMIAYLPSFASVFGTTD